MEDFDPEIIVASMLANQEIEQSERYLARGRQYATLSEEQLTELWVPCFRKFSETAGANDTTELDDLGAEFALRGIQPPVYAVKEELESLRLRISAKAAEGPRELSPEFEEKISRVLAERQKPQN